ncbi:hypothetical protein FRB99_000911 [Tulasnella sp. 403]|nr:hypothetical protein FRB99_000911 [Tulasnella sp. 403]
MDPVFAKLDKDFYGLPSNPPCVYKSGPAWRERTGPESTSIYQFLDSQGVKWTSIDPVAFAEEGEVKPFYPLLMWVGVYPESLFYNVAVAAAETIKGILAQAGFPEIDVAFRESVVTRSVAPGPKLLSYNPLRDPVPELLKPFTPTLGLSIAPLRTPYYEGTGALYLRVSNANKRTVLLTAAHVARPPPAFANTGMSRRRNSQAAEEIVALGDKGYSNAVTSMLSAIGDLASLTGIWNDGIARLPEPAEGEEKKKIEKINKLHSDVTRFRTTPEQRITGFVRHVEPIAVSDGPHQFTRDWALIELYEEKIDWDSFKGNKVYIGGNLLSSDYGKIMFPRPEVQAGYKYPRDGLLQARHHHRSPTRGAFSAPRDSGAIVLERGGGIIIGMLTGGSGTTEETDTTYLTPYWWLDEQIKKVLPGCYLYDVVQ